MSNSDNEVTNDDLVRQELEARLRAARIAAIHEKTVWTFDDLREVIGVASSTFELLIRRHPVDGAFRTGRIRSVMADAGRDWINLLAKANSYDGAAQYNRREVTK